MERVADTPMGSVHTVESRVMERRVEMRDFARLLSSFVGPGCVRAGASQRVGEHTFARDDQGFGRDGQRDVVGYENSSGYVEAWTERIFSVLVGVEGGLFEVGNG